MTLKQMVNKILRRLREDEITNTNESEYSTLIVEFVNEAMEEVQSRYLWSNLDAYTEFQTVASQFGYNLADYLTGSGDVKAGSNLTNERSMLRIVDDIAPVYLYDGDGTTDTEGKRLKLVSNFEMQDMYRQDQSNTGEPEYIALFKTAANDGWTARLYPLPDGEYTVRILFWSPQEAFAVDATDDSDEIKPPNNAVFTFALMMAANERGEEMGEPGNILERRYIAAIGEAVENEIYLQGAGNVYEFRRD